MSVSPKYFSQTKGSDSFVWADPISGAKPDRDCTAIPVTYPCVVPDSLSPNHPCQRKLTSWD
jgi:hypothetical protein